MNNKNNENSIISVRNLKKTFSSKNKEVFSLKDINMDIPKGSIIGIIGKSGAGKSTLLRFFNGLEHPDAGDIFFEKTNLTNATEKTLKSIRRKIGMIFQHFNLLARRTALENIILPLEIIGYSKTKRIKRAKECLQLVGLSNRENAYPNELSGGQKQRVAIARAIASETHLLLSDEATSALDPETTAEILHLLKDINKRLGITIILITHEIDVIRDICEYVYVMDHGRIVEEGSIETIFATPQHPVTQSFIHSLINSKIPELIKTLLTPTPEDDPSDIVLRLNFKGGAAEQPIIAHFIRNYGTDINIAAGYLDHIGKSTFGTLIVTLPNQKQTIQNAKDFLSSQGVHVETLGYISKNHSSKTNQ